MAEDDSRPAKRLRREEPDLTVIVGGTEFKCYSQVIRYASEYIDTMLSVDMKESVSKTIEFPDKNPEEWKLFYPFLEPRAAHSSEETELTVPNVKVLVPWFHEFGMTNMLKECDAVYFDYLQKHTVSLLELLKPAKKSEKADRGLRLQLTMAMWDSYDQALTFASVYHLHRSEEASLGFLESLFSDFLDWSDPHFVSHVLPRLMENPLHRERLWPCVEKYIPEALRDEAPENLVKEKCFAHMLAANEKNQHSTCYRVNL